MVSGLVRMMRGWRPYFVDDWRCAVQRAFGAAVVVLLVAAVAVGAPAPTRPSEIGLEYHKKASPSRLKIGVAPDARVARTRGGLVLGVRVTNASASEITTTLAREWHGGEWPMTALYASVTPAKAKEPRGFMPVYLVGPDQKAPRVVTLAAGKSVELKLRMDWPGTGSVIAVPLITEPGEHVVRFVLVFEAAGKRQYVATAPQVIQFRGK